ncbi:hypothetical protein GCM10027038_39590 [Arthrobacter bambusae]
MAVMHRAKAFKDLGDGLVKFQLARVPRQDGVPDCFQPRIHVTPYNFCAERRICNDPAMLASDARQSPSEPNTTRQPSGQR